MENGKWKMEKDYKAQRPEPKTTKGREDGLTLDQSFPALDPAGERA
jgi:hypothetical protein